MPLSLEHSKDREIFKDTSGSTQSFFSDLLDLVSVLFGRAPDFMSSRFKDNVWPLLAKVLRSQLKWTLLHDNNVKSSDLQRPTCSDRTRNKVTERILKCIATVFAESTLTILIPSVGDSCMPFLAHRGAVGEAAMNAMKAMLRLDFTYLWRSLIQLANKDIYPNPLRLQEDVKSIVKCVTIDEDAPINIICERARLLLKFIDEMEEQELC